MRRAVIATAVVALLAPATAAADYSGAVDATAKTATLTGSGSVVITTSGGLLSHNALGSGFAGATDFDSTQAGDQTVPDTGQWTVSLTGSGSDSLELDEGESTSPITFASGHTFTPGGVPCIVRDPNARNGIDFSEHPTQETRFCYAQGIDSVTVRAGSGNTEFDVLDTQQGVPLHFYGGAGGTDVQMAADVPTEVGGFHNAVSPVTYTAGSGATNIAFNDDVGTTPATYTIGSRSIVKSGLEPLNFSGLKPTDGIQLYPQSGPSTIDIGPTGGVPVQIFGGFFSQPGPDHIDGSHADAQLIITGSLGNDTIIGGPQPDFIDGGGGNDTITAAGGGDDQVSCDPLSASVANVDAGDMVTGCKTVNLVSFTPTLKGLRIARHGTTLTLTLPSAVTGTLTLGFKRAACRHAHGCHRYVSEGSRTVRLTGKTKLVVSARTKRRGRLRALPAGTYRISAVLSAGAKKSTPVTLTVTIR
jgi:hypothetical protein